MVKYSHVSLWNITDTDMHYNVIIKEKSAPSNFKTPKGKDLDWSVFGEDFYLAYDSDSGKVHALINQDKNRELREKSRSDGGTGIFTPEEDKIWRNFYKIEKEKSSTKSEEIKIETPTEKFEKQRKIREIGAALKKQGLIVSLSTLSSYFEKYKGEVTLEAALEKFNPTTTKKEEIKPSPAKEIETTTEESATKPLVNKEEVKEKEEEKKEEKKDVPLTLVLEEKTDDKNPIKKKEATKKGSWQEDYLTSITKYSDLDIDKKTNEKRRTCSGVIEDKKLNVDLTPTPEFAKRREQSARYEFAEGETPNKIAVSVQANQFKDFAILFKAAKENGVKFIEFNKTQTDEFRHLALAAALTLGLEVKNAPGMVDMSAEYLTRMPPKAREALEKHNEKIRQKIEKNKEEHTSKPKPKPLVKPVRGIGD